MRRFLVVAAVLVCAGIGTESARAAEWCGGAEASASDRLPDAVSSNQIHVVYAFPSDAPDRFSALASPIVADLSAVEAWWRGQDPTRAPRFDLFPFPNCPPGLGGLDLARVQLPNDSAYYLDLDSRFGRLVSDLPFAFAHSFKKYLLYYDGPVEETRVCGQSSVRPTSGGRTGVSVVFLAARCPDDLGAGAFEAAVAAHELTHSLGALVVPGPPNACPQDAGHACDSEQDLMFSFLRAPLAQLVLDVGRNDYYGHPGAWWDVQDSEWLSRLDAPQHGLSVSVAGTGTVESDRPGIACPPACAISWDAGTSLNLLAQPGAGTRFVGWTGACSGRTDCDVLMDQAKTVTARFARQFRLRVQVVARGGSGSVVSTPSGVACPVICSAAFDEGTQVRLRARAGRRSRFAGWGGACRGTGRCLVRLSAGRSVRAVFRSR